MSLSLTPACRMCLWPPETSRDMKPPAGRYWGRLEVRNIMSGHSQPCHWWNQPCPLTLDVVGNIVCQVDSIFPVSPITHWLSNSHWIQLPLQQDAVADLRMGGCPITLSCCPNRFRQEKMSRESCLEAKCKCWGGPNESKSKRTKKKFYEVTKSVFSSVICPKV